MNNRKTASKSKAGAVSAFKKKPDEAKSTGHRTVATKGGGGGGSGHKTSTQSSGGKGGGGKRRGSVRTAPKNAQKDPAAAEEAKFQGYLTILRRKSMMADDEIRARYRQFQRDVPTGMLSQERFHEMSGSQLGDNAAELINTIYKVFDEDKNGYLDFVEYMMAVQSTTVETPEKKLEWIFRMYDKDGSGSIETEELKHLFQTLFDMSGVIVEDKQMNVLIHDVMQTLDEDGNGEVDLQEFINGSLKTPFIMSLLCPED